ncbi:MAG: HlyD family efflux transporter periplasmic adaptor subunit [Ruminococcaceae bacterium]|nr:HlyD family efflux transporter periplasmic adaptor subunit [Oscillospiraceae bacterium]
MSEKNNTETQTNTAQEIFEGKNNKKPKNHKRRRLISGIIRWLSVIVLIAGVCIFVWKNDKAYSFAQKYISFLPERSAAVQSTSGYTVAPAERRTISVTLTGTGTLQPIDSYTITAKVTGEIMSADFEEMDIVEKDQVLYTIDSADLQSDIRDFADNVEDAREALDELMEDYTDLVLYSDYGGVCEEVYVEEDDTVQKGAKIAHIIDRDTMLLEVPFFVQDIPDINVGQSAVVTVNSASDSVIGVVTKIGSLETVTSVGAKLRTVTVSVKNPGSITTATTAYAIVGDIESAGEGTFKYNVDEEITAVYSGEIETLNISEGDRISEGSVILKISSENLDDQKENLEKQLEKAQENYNDYLEKLEDYTITAPIAGTVVQKNYKASDNISSGTGGNSALAIIYDMSKLNFEMNIDELDLSLIKEGQEVSITSDSFDETYTGYVKKKSIIGSSSMGTTTYPVTIELDGNDVLLPGMNVNATIYIEKVENALAVPVEAIMRGNKVRVLKKDAGNGAPGDKIQQEKETFGKDEMPQMPEKMEISDMSQSDREKLPQRQQGFERHNAFGNMNVQEGDFDIVEVVTGVSDDDYVEIVSGLEEGDMVVILNTTVDSSATVTGGMMGMGSMGGMGSMPSMGGNMGGGFNSGNMGGRMPR